MNKTLEARVDRLEKALLKKEEFTYDVIDQLDELQNNVSNCWNILGKLVNSNPELRSRLRNVPVALNKALSDINSTLDYVQNW